MILKQSQILSDETYLIPWTDESLAELQKIPGFVRGKVKRNTEKYALEQNLSEISLEVMYKAKQTVGA